MVAETFIIIAIMAIAVLGPAIVIALVGQSTIKALARNPSASFKIFTGMVIVLVAVESIAIVALVVIFQLFSN